MEDTREVGFYGDDEGEDEVLASVLSRNVKGKGKSSSFHKSCT
jgi:hypothetical protein